ncbi:hypothetical protein B0H63DRAFT_524303 [Podospora didyma]|uniref:DUF676 domain-containing protein n=1 Tax=Podospora didyma TaxID=330526 RepID=A0AAE0NHF0_9PEZI|nr:hypothetical protein B0H63DRAFT_524303 [Podospora didyma]
MDVGRDDTSDKDKVVKDALGSRQTEKLDDGASLRQGSRISLGDTAREEPAYDPDGKDVVLGLHPTQASASSSRSAQADPEPGFAPIDGDKHAPNSSEALRTNVDIIAVPCPGADPLVTFTSEALAQADFPAMFRLSSNVMSPTNPGVLSFGHNWVMDLRRPVTTARVLLYKHRALFDGMVLAGLAKELLDQVQHIRQGANPSRPLFFIAHSIGGLVVKQALLLASQFPDVYGNIMTNCHGVTFFATPHRGSSYISMRNLGKSIAQLLHLQRPLPRSLADELRVNSPSLARMHEQFVDIASELCLWSLYETKDSLLSGSGGGIITEVQFEAPLVSIKSALLEIWQEDIFSVDSDHGHLASFGPENISTMTTYISDLTAAIRKAIELSAYIHHPLKLTDIVKAEVIGFYPDGAGDVDSSTTRLYSTKNSLREFLEKGPERCLGERLSKVPKRLNNQGHPHHPIADITARTGSHESVDLGINQQMGEEKPTQVAPGDSEPGSPDIVVTNPPTRPSIQPMGGPSSVPPGLAGQAHGLSTTALLTSDFRPPSVERSRADSLRTSSEPAIQLSKVDAADFLGEESNHFGPMSRQRAELLIKSSVLRDELAAGFSRPDPSSRKFMWIHLGYNNPVWVKSVFNKLKETHGLTFSNLWEYDHWESKHIQNRHSESQPAFLKTSCNYITTEPILPRATSSSLNGLASPGLALSAPNCLYLYFPYLHFDTYWSILKRRRLVQKRRQHGRANPVPGYVANLDSDELKVIWEYVGFDPPLSPRRTLDQFGHHSLRDTYSRDDDQMLYKLTKKPNNDALPESVNWPQSHRNQSTRGSFASGYAPSGTEEDEGAEFEKLDPDIEHGNVLMVDQLWLWAINTTSLITFFPKRESKPTEGRLFQQADLRNSVYNELNGDLTGKTDNALDLAALIVWHAVIVLLDRSSHPDLELFRLFEEAIGMLSERLTFNMRSFRRELIDESRSSDDSASGSDVDSEWEPGRNSAASIKRRHQRELKRAEHENRENTSALLELRDMEDELSILSKLFDSQETQIKVMKGYFERDELKQITHNGQEYLDEALEYLAEFKEKTDEMLSRIHTTRRDYEKAMEMAQRQAQVDEVRWSRLQTELASSQNLSVMIFTTFTVIFLPLTFFTGLFGMNTEEWQNDVPSIITIGQISLPASAIMIIASLLAAFSWRVQRMFKAVFAFAERSWNASKGYLRKLEPEWRMRAKRERRKRKLQRRRNARASRDKDGVFDFWHAVRQPQQNLRLNRSSSASERTPVKKRQSA